jgi:hypothetical protein
MSGKSLIWKEIPGRHHASTNERPFTGAGERINFIRKTLAES